MRLIGTSYQNYVVTKKKQTILPITTHFHGYSIFHNVPVDRKVEPKDRTTLHDSMALSHLLTRSSPLSQTPTATSSAWCLSTTSSGTSRPAARRRGTSGSRPSSSRSCTRSRATSRTRARRARGTPSTPRPSPRSRTRCRATSSAPTAMRRVSGRPGGAHVASSSLGFRCYCFCSFSSCYF